MSREYKCRSSEGPGFYTVLFCSSVFVCHSRILFSVHVQSLYKASFHDINNPVKPRNMSRFSSITKEQVKFISHGSFGLASFDSNSTYVVSIHMVVARKRSPTSFTKKLRNTLVFTDLMMDDLHQRVQRCHQVSFTLSQNTYYPSPL